MSITKSPGIYLIDIQGNLLTLFNTSWKSEIFIKFV